MRSRRTSWISACYHPFFVGVVCFLFIVYKLFPSLFSLLLNSSPVIACTTLLLGIFLSYGEPNVPENKKDHINMTQTSSSLKIEPVANDLGCKNEENFKVEAHLGGRRGKATKRTTIKTIASGVRRLSAASRAVKEDEVNQMDATSVDSNSFVEEDHSKNNFIEEKGYHIGNLAEGLQNMKEHIGRVIALSFTVLSAKANRTKLDPSDPCLDSQWRDNHQDDSSYSKSNGKEMSDSHAANGVSVLDELDPLLDSETSQADLVSKDNADDGSVSFSQNHVSEDGSGEEEAETQDDDDDEEAQEEKDDGNKAAVTWTADDQRTLMELGNTELERNLRLEILIAKRKASKAMEKNLIDLDDNIDEILQSHGHLPSVNAPRRNPFDLPDVLDESVPGSAPSVLLPRRNPFDLPYEQVDDEENSSHKEFVAVPQHDIPLRRHESFTVGASFFSDFNQEKHSSRFMPYFGAEEMDFADPQRKLREISDSNVKSTLKSDTVSSVTDQEHPKDLHRLTGSPITNSAGSAENDSQVESQMKMNDDHTNHLNHSIMMEQTHQATENIGAVEYNTTGGSESRSPISYAVRSEVTKEVCESSSTSLEAEKNTSRISTHEQISNQEQITSGSSKDSMVSAKSVAADSDTGNMKADHVHDGHVVEPVYDSSPTQTEKSHSNSALDEAPYIAAERNVPPSSDAPSANGFIWFASPSLASVDENEAASREISVIKELDVIGDEARVRKDSGRPLWRILPSPAARKRTLHSSLSAVEIQSNEGS
ncbi:uncharacterized protein LOC135645221 isoform X1 [Musa acuminata AAA Group]|uniref:uncharacterized protein LOC135645221 isoform X1 n=1 Tax=Musa acuminata AAA Group TaxID=214697 RepID=UPI0031CDE476